MPGIISPKVQILFLSTIGIYRTVMEFYNQNLDEVWQLELTDSLSSYQNLITTVISAIILVRQFTGHLYIASYFLILYPIIMGKMRTVLLIWMFISGVRSILLNLGVAIIGIVVCSSRLEFTYACLRFVAAEAVELGCSVYLWTVINDYYHSMKKISPRSHLQSPLASPISSGQIGDETSSSFLSDEWSLPSSLVEEFQKNTKENLLESVTKTTSDSAKNLKTRSVDSLLAQAMVDWFLKKIVKFKPKGEQETSTPLKLTNMNSYDIATLRKRIKQSIADVDDNELKDLIDSEKHEEATTSQIIESVGEKIVRVVTHDDPDLKISREMPKLNEISVEATLKPILTRGESEIMPDLISDINKNQLDFVKYLVKTEPSSNPFSKESTSGSTAVKLDSLEPLNALNFVRHLFKDSFENTLDLEVKKKKLDSGKVVRLDASSINFVDDSSTDDDSLYRSNGSSIDVNEKALDCSFVIVKSIIDDMITNVIDDGNLNKTLKDITTESKIINTIRTDIIANNLLHLKDCDSKNKFTERNKQLNKRISFLDKDESVMDNVGESLKFNIDTSVRTNFDDFPENVRSVLKHVNTERLARKSGKIGQLRKPYDKENALMQQNETEMSVKALRYHFRRTNQSKVPIQKRPRESALSQKSIKVLLDVLKLQDLNKNSLHDIVDNPKKINFQNGYISRGYQSKNHILKESSAQTVSTKQLLSRIKEAEEKDREKTARK